MISRLSDVLSPGKANRNLSAFISLYVNTHQTKLAIALLLKVE